jgi:hypothetical protein
MSAIVAAEELFDVNKGCQLPRSESTQMGSPHTSSNLAPNFASRPQSPSVPCQPFSQSSKMTPNIKRSVTSQDETLEVYSGARTSKWIVPLEGRSVLEVQVIKNAAAWKDVPAEKNYLIPPYHWHWYQEEYFDVKRG